MFAKKCVVVSSLVLCSSCVHVGQVDMGADIGDEIRPDGNRQSASLGLTTKMINGVKIKTKYRHRLTDFDINEAEHGFFVGVSVPLWKKSKR